MNEYNNNEYSSNMETPVKFKEWLISLLVMYVPIVNIVMMFVWAFGDNVAPSKKNFFRAMLIFMGISFILSFIWWVFIIFINAGTALSSSYY